MSVSKDTTINPQQLDVEWIVLPELFYKYGEEFDLTEFELKKLKMKLDVLEATLDRKFRQIDRNSTSKKSITEGQIKACIKINPEWQELQEKILETELRKKNIQTVCKALEFKKDALKQLVTLYTNEYYSSPTTDSDGAAYLGKQNEVSQKNVRKDIKRNLKRKRRNEDG